MGEDCFHGAFVVRFKGSSRVVCSGCQSYRRVGGFILVVTVTGWGVDPIHVIYTKS